MAGRVPQIMQMEALECGAASLSMICAYYGKWIPLEKVRVDCGVSRDGSSALNVVKAARSYGLDARGFRFEPETLAQKGLFPCICHMGFSHFVVVRGFKGDKVYINDPARGEVKMSMEDFDNDFTGVALLFEPTDDFVADGKPASVKEFALERLKGARTALLFVALTSAIGSLLTMVNPALSRVFMDRLLTGLNPSWNTPYLVLVSIFAVIQVVIAALNAVYLLRVEGKMAAVSSASFLWKVLHMPMEFFSQRMTGDIIQRASNNASVAQRVVSQLAPLAINFVMLGVYLVLMVTYSPLLSLIGIFSVIVNIVVARITSSRRMNMSRVMMRDSANLSSLSYDMFSMIETLKAQGVEHGFFRRWSGFQASVNRQNNNITRVGIVYSLVPSIVKSLCDTSILAIGIWLIMNGQFTVGMLTSMQSFISMFSSPAESLIGVMQTFQEMRVDMERIKDVMDYPIDPLSGLAQEQASELGESTVDQDMATEKLRGEVELKNVTFGYSRLAEPVVRDFSMHVKPGGCVALVGASGCGKSTISKLVAGLYRPWSGTIELDGHKLEEIPRSVRTGSMAVIDQDVVLFSDTIGNNIRLWDDSIENYEVVLAARDACIHDAIMERPGAYNAELAEDGRDLSGGQRQRLEIARALAGDPTVLIMDEATSALDARTEARVMEAIRRRGITLIVVAHRLSTVRDADEIIVFEDGQVVERGRHEELYAAGGAYTRLVSQE